MRSRPAASRWTSLALNLLARHISYRNGPDGNQRLAELERRKRVAWDRGTGETLLDGHQLGFGPGRHEGQLVGCPSLLLFSAARG